MTYQAHVSDEEMRDAADPAVGDGTSLTAPAVLPEEEPPMRTVGISPKLIAAVVTAVATYIIGQELVELPVLVEVALQALLVGIAAWRANPGAIAPSRDQLKGQVNLER